MSAVTVQEACARGELKAVKTSPRGHWRIPRAALEDWLKGLGRRFPGV